MNRAELNKLHTRIFEAASGIYAELGQGLDIQVYQTCFQHELRLNGLKFKRDVPFPVYYKDVKLNIEVFAELLVEDHVIVELRPEIEITQHHVNAMLSKLKISGRRMGIIITFNAPGIVDGYRKVLNN